MHGSHLLRGRLEQLESADQLFTPLDGAFVLAQNTLQLRILTVGHLCLQLVQQLLLALQDLQDKPSQLKLSIPVAC